LVASLWNFRADNNGKMFLWSNFVT
jgi:hypothetical protein